MFNNPNEQIFDIDEQRRILKTLITAVTHITIISLSELSPSLAVVHKDYIVTLFFSLFVLIPSRLDTVRDRHVAFSGATSVRAFSEDALINN